MAVVLGMPEVGGEDNQNNYRTKLIRTVSVLFSVAQFMYHAFKLLQLVKLKYRLDHMGQ